MFTRLSYLIGPPTFADEEQDRVARILFVIQLTLLTAALAVLVIGLIVGDASTVVGLLWGSVFTVAALWLNRRGHTRSSSFTIMLMLFSLATFLLLTGQGIHDIAITLYPVIIIVASLLLDRRAFLVIVALIVITLGVIVYIEMNHGLAVAYPLPTRWSDFAILALILIITAVSVRFLSDSLIENLQRARRNEQALATSNTQLRQETARLEILLEIDRAILAAQSLDSIARAVLEQMRPLIRARYAALVLFDFTRHTHDIFALQTDRVQPNFRERRPLDQFEIMPSLWQGQPYVVNDLPAVLKPTAMEQKILAEGSRAYIDVPLVLGGDLIGALSFESVETQVFDAARVTLVEQVANHLALAVRDARLLESEQQRVALMTALHEVALNVNAQMDLPALLNTIVTQAAQLIQAEMGSLFLLQPDGQTLLEVCRYHLPDSDTFTRMQLGEGLSGLVALTGDALVIDDYQQWPLRHPQAAQVPYRSALAAPIKWKDRVLGTITILDTQPGQFSADDLKAVDTLAAQAAVALQNARSFESEQNRVALLKTLYELGVDLSAQRDLPALLQLVVERAARLLKAPMGYLYLQLPDNVTLQLKVAHHLPPEFAAEQVRIGEGLAGYVAQIGEAHFVEDYPMWSGRYAWTGDPYRSGLAVPIRWQERILGVLGVLYDRPVTRAEVDVEAMQLLAAQAAVAIENTRLFEAVHQQLDDLRVLQAVSTAAADVGDESELIRRVTEIVGLTMTPFSFGVLLLDEAEQLLRAHASYHGISAAAQRQPIPVGTGITGWVAKHGRTRRVPDVNRVPDFLRVSDRTRSELAVPVKLGRQVLGVLNAESGQLDAFTDEDERLLTTIASQLATALVRLRASAERESLIVDLEAKNAELERFTYTVSHDLKSPLITIRGFLGYLEKDARAGNWERLDADTARIIEATDKMQRLLNELLELSRIGRLMNSPEAVPYATITQEALQLTQGRIEARGVRIDIQPELPVVQGDHVRLVEVIQNLIDNACKFMGDQPEPKITIGWRGPDRDGKPILFVQDNGIGIDPQYHAKVFGLFNKLDVQTEGTGIGLALVKRIVEVHGGRIWVESAGVNCGSTFLFTLPGPPFDLVDQSVDAGAV
jgi:GAF domain-containing protein